MKNDEIVLGYQLRKSPKNIDSNFWNSERRNKYLLNTDIDFQISVDTNAWPESEDNDLKNNLFCAQDVEHDPLYLNADLYQLKPSLRDIKIEILQENVLIAVTILQEYASLFFTKRSVDKIKFLDSTHTLKEKIVFFYGYDIADGLLFSALSDCSFSEEERKRFHDLFSNDLNRYGLFENKLKAIDYCKLSNNRIPEHAPFYVFGIYSFSQGQE